MPPTTFDGVGGFSSANTLLKLSDDIYLIGGTANTSVKGPNSSLNYCYNGDVAQGSDAEALSRIQHSGGCLAGIVLIRVSSDGHSGQQLLPTQ